jgi:hypothetical protein
VLGLSSSRAERSNDGIHELIRISINILTLFLHLRDALMMALPLVYEYLFSDNGNKIQARGFSSPDGFSRVAPSRRYALRKSKFHYPLVQTSPPYMRQRRCCGVFGRRFFPG